MIRARSAVASLALSLVFLAGCGAREERDELMVFAAASLQDVMGDLGASFAARHGSTPAFNFAGSNALAQQILAAPRGQVFLSADRAWVDHLEERGLVANGSRRKVFANSLVLVANIESATEVSNVEEMAELEGTHLALGDPSAVPAGRYARAALSALPSGDSTLWQRIASRIVPTADVRAALALIESTTDTLGIVYRTDADSSPRVRVLCTIETPTESPIAYWAVAIDGAPHAADAFLDFLTTPAAQRIAERHGFLPAGLLDG